MIRLYKPEDEPHLRRIFAEQELAVGVPLELPLPGNDRGSLVTYVSVADGKPEAALILRLTAEVHLVISPKPDGIYRVKRLADEAEGGLLILSDQLEKMRFGAITEVVTFVPTARPRMLQLMPHLGFTAEPEEMRAYWRKVGR